MRTHSDPVASSSSKKQQFALILCYFSICMWITFCFVHSCISFVHPNIISRKQQFKQSPVVLEDTEYSHQMQSLLIGMNESLDFLPIMRLLELIQKRQKYIPNYFIFGKRKWPIIHDDTWI